PRTVPAAPLQLGQSLPSVPAGSHPLSLRDALPISGRWLGAAARLAGIRAGQCGAAVPPCLGPPGGHRAAGRTGARLLAWRTAVRAATCRFGAATGRLPVGQPASPPAGGRRASGSAAQLRQPDHYLGRGSSLLRALWPPPAAGAG